MSNQLEFSIQTIQALVQVVTGGAGGSTVVPIGIYRSGPTLEQIFAAAGIELTIGNASRVPSVRDALRACNQTEDGRAKIGKLIEIVADKREYHTDPSKHSAVVDHLNSFLRDDGWILCDMNGKAQLSRAGAANMITGTLKIVAKEVDFDSVKLDFERALAQAETDPEDAVTSACSTVESVFKCILDEMKEPLPNKQDIGGLAKAIEDKLNLAPSRTDVELDIKQILGGLCTVTRGIGALRTHCGDAHGKGRRVKRIDARIARLAIHAASTMSLFYIETWKKHFVKPQEQGAVK